MRRRKAGERIEPFRRRLHEAAGVSVRNRIELWARACADSLTLPEPGELPPEIQDRDADVWEALIAIANAAGGKWPERARQAAVALVSASREAEASLGVLLLTHIKAAFGDAEQLATDVLLHRLHELEEAPWKDLKGKPLNDRGLASRLRQYGIKPQVIRIGEATPRGYRWQDFVDAWARYVDPPPSSARSATSTTSQCLRAPRVADGGANVADTVAATGQKNSNKNNRVVDVALVAPVAANGGGADDLPDSPRRCAQCNAPGDPSGPVIAHDDHVWLHRECRRFWLKEHSQ
jgi:hypothetical protein